MAATSGEKWFSEYPEELQVLLHEKYDIKSILGQGGTAVVFLALQKDLGRDVAIKVQKHDPSSIHASLKRAQFEAKIISSLKHDNLITVHSFDHVGEITCMVCEYVEGESLAQCLTRRGALPLEETLELAKQALSGLSYLHERGIIHRDLKPANMLLPANPPLTLKLADFGLALAPDRDYQTQSGVILGTVDYICPELMTGQQATAQSDLYALGIILFEMLTGKPPFAGASDREVLIRHLTSRPPSLASVGSFIPPTWLDNLVNRLLEKDPKQRPESATEVMKLLERVEAATVPAPTLENKNDMFPAEPHRRDSRSRLADGHNPATVVNVEPGRGAEHSAKPRPVSRPRVRPKSGSRERPSRASVKPMRWPRLVKIIIGLGALIVLVRMLMVVDQRRVKTVIGELVFQVSRDELRLTGTFSGGPLSMGFSGSGANWTTCTAIDGKCEAVAIPFPAGNGKAPSEVELRQGGETIVKFTLPQLSRHTIADFGSLEMREADSRFAQWQAHLGSMTRQGEIESVNLPGSLVGNRVVFPPFLLQDRLWVNLEKITAQTRYPAHDSAGASFPVKLQILCQEALVTKLGLRELLYPQLKKRVGEGRKLAGVDDVKTNWRELAGLVFNPPDAGHFDVRRLMEAEHFYADFFKNPSVELSKKLETYEWLCEIGDLYAYTRERGVPPSPELESILNSFISVRYGDLESSFHLGGISKDKLLVFKLPDRNALDGVLTGAANEIGYFNFILSPDAGRPPFFRDAFAETNLTPAHRIQSPPPSSGAEAESVVLRLNVWNQRRGVTLTLQIPRRTGSLGVHCYNFANQRTIDFPARGAVSIPANLYSWKNINRTGARVEIQIPLQVLDEVSNQTFEVKCDRSLGKEDLSEVYVGVVGYDWSIRKKQ